MMLLSKLSLLVCTMFLAGNLCAQAIHFPLDAAPVTIDGVMNTSEWTNANSIGIPVSATDTVRVKFKHDGMAMYFAFYGKLQTANALFPEVLTDGANVGGSSWVAGQWWLHVSATDCENQGGYGIYNNCKTVQPDWEGAPNFIMTGPPTDTVEMRVPFSKVGFDPATMESMGMMMLVTNTATIFQGYPAAADRNMPATWGKATFGKFL